MCNTPVLFKVAWLVGTFLYLKMIASVLREVLKKGVLPPFQCIVSCP